MVMKRKRKSSIRTKSVMGILLLLLLLIPTALVMANPEDGDSKRDLLKLTLDYNEKLDSSVYQADSWNRYQEVLKKATESYDNSSLEEDIYHIAKHELLTARANLEFVPSTAAGNPLHYRVLTPDQIVKEMGTGWNLGNTMDGHTGFAPNETLWQNVVTTKELMESLHNMGFNTIRIPVTWGTMIDDKNGYAIDETWISRVEDIVDYCVAFDMYAIINIHHDGAEQTGWLRVAADDLDPVYEKFEKVWRHIANRFKDYDEHLIFESMNEVTGENPKQDTKVIMDLNQIFVNTIRATGSNNAERWLSVPGRYTNMESMTNETIGFDIPKDAIEQRLFVSVHHYDYAFGLVETTATTKFHDKQAIGLAEDLSLLKDKFTSKGIPVIMGEYGAINKDNPIERAYHFETFTRAMALNGIVPIYWDQGWYDRSLTPDFSFTLVDRITHEIVDPLQTDAILRGTYLTGSADLSDIQRDTKVNPITEITIEQTEATVTLGNNIQLTAKIQPEESNEVLLWKSSDDTIATVFHGNVRARGIGTATLTAYNPSKTVEQSMLVTVLPNRDGIKVTEISLDQDRYEISVGDYLYLSPVVAPTEADDYISYKSSNEEVATISSRGKLLGMKAGTAYIIMTSSTGLTKSVMVKVNPKTATTDLNLALNVYFNDNEKNFYSNEFGQSIVVSSEGQYTVVFDATTDLSDTAKAAGVTGLNNMTAIYIKDHDVTLGEASSTPLEACFIQYNKIVVDGVELTINQTEPKSALKNSGILDTNDPFNSWDGSVVNEVTVDNHVLNITGIDNPQKVEITFTLSGMAYKSEEEVAVVEATALDIIGDKDIKVEELGKLVDLEVLMTPGQENTRITFVSSDSSIVYIDTTAVITDGSTGKVHHSFVPLSEGSATITVRSENGLENQYTITVAAKEEVAAVEEVEPTTEAGEEANTSNTEDGGKVGLTWPMILIIVIIAIVVLAVVIILVIKKKKQ